MENGPTWQKMDCDKITDVGEQNQWAEKVIFRKKSEKSAFALPMPLLSSICVV